MEVTTRGRPHDPILLSFDSKTDAQRMFAILNDHASLRNMGKGRLVGVRYWKIGENRDLAMWREKETHYAERDATCALCENGSEPGHEH